jgi:hypothetical protein
MVFPSRFTRSKRNEEAAAQARYLRMTAKPTDGLLVCFTAARTGNLDFGIFERAFGDDTAPFGQTKMDTMTSSSDTVYRDLCGSSGVRS